MPLCDVNDENCPICVITHITMTPDQQNTALELLKWFSEMGADEAIADEPADWFARSEAQQQAKKAVVQAQKTRPAPTSQPAQPPARPRNAAPAPIAPDKAVMAAREQARSAKSLKELQEILLKFDGCALKATAKNTCFKRGSDEARIMFIGEGPGRDEDIQGIPFVGRAGQLLDKMLSSVGLGEEQVYITNIVYWRPPGNRTPTPQEVQACAPFLERQIELLDPAFIVLIGAPSSHHILDVTEGITRLRGKWKQRDIGGKARACLPILHPAYLLRTPAAKRLAWRDMLAIRDKFDEIGETKEASTDVED